MKLREAAEAVVEKAGRPVHGEVFTVISYEHTEALRAALAEPDELAEAVRLLKRCKSIFAGANLRTDNIDSFLKRQER